MDLVQQINRTILESVQKSITTMLGSAYNNPLTPIVNQVVAANEPQLKALLNDSLSGLLTDTFQRTQLKEAIQHRLARLLIERFGGELEKSVNVLKSDPTTRARITTAIDDIVRSSIKNGA